MSFPKNPAAVSSRALPRARRASLCVAGAALSTLLGCADPGSSFTAFSERYDKIFAERPPTACPEAYTPLSSGQADGQYLLALSASLKPMDPIIFLAEVITPAQGSGVGIGFTLTPLAKADRKTPAGDPQTYGPVAIDDAGKFTIDFAKLKVTKDANPIIGVEVEADVTLTGNVCGDASFVCGDVTGSTVSPKANLEGSTFTLMRIDDPEKYPVPVLNCEQAPANPPK